jgi:ABC-type nitrate/sulfonate/bicarbonate transport system substrate-binding protein
MLLRQGGWDRSFALVTSIAETHSLAKKLAEKVYKIEYPEFPAGPQRLEALNVGSIDLGSIGESPPIFAQAAGASQVYVANLPNSGTSGEGRAILVNKNSPIHSVLDLRRQRVAFQRGSSAHLFAECLDPPWVAQWKILVHVLYFRTHKENSNSNGIIVYVLA